MISGKMCACRTLRFLSSTVTSRTATTTTTTTTPFLGRAVTLARHPPPRVLTGWSLVTRWSSSTTATTNTKKKKICIHFATSTGTAQMFAHDLYNALQEQDNEITVQVQDLGQTQELQALDETALHLFLVSTTGVGAFPGAAQAFMTSVDEAVNNNNTNTNHKIQFGIFGLGNSAAHPQHYNVASKTLYDKLVAAHAQPWMPLALGDDGDCIEDDYDQWQAQVLEKLRHDDTDDTTTGGQDGQTQDTATTKDSEASSATSPKATETSAKVTETTAPPPPFGKRLQLVPCEASEDEITRTDLWNAVPSFYHAQAQRFRVTRHKTLSPQPTANALHEIQLNCASNPNAPLEYTAGDHLVVYPCHSDYLVEAYLDHFQISIEEAMHSKVEPTAAVAGLCEASASPHPTGVSLYDTLRYLVDLQSPPSPRLARTLLGRDDIDYKEQVYVPRKSPLALLKQSGNRSISLEDLLYQLPPQSPRYYSISSSSVAHPRSIYLTYRPVAYITSQDVPQTGVCTSYFSKLQDGCTLMAYINHNPEFRLPDDPSVPIILLAGGCGVAAVRSLVEELQTRGRTNPTYIFLGFRSQADEAYLDVMESINPKLLDVAYSISCSKADMQCGLVSDRVKAHGPLLFDLLQNQGAYIYLCGGARTFGAAIQRELYTIYETVGQCSPEEGKAALEKLLEQGRYCEDLADG